MRLGDDHDLVREEIIRRAVPRVVVEQLDVIDARCSVAQCARQSVGVEREIEGVRAGEFYLDGKSIICESDSRIGQAAAVKDLIIGLAAGKKDGNPGGAAHAEIDPDLFSGIDETVVEVDGESLPDGKGTAIECVSGVELATTVCKEPPCRITCDATDICGTVGS